jgi:hypothetical protein
VEREFYGRACKVVDCTLDEPLFVEVGGRSPQQVSGVEIWESEYGMMLNWWADYGNATARISLFDNDEAPAALLRQAVEQSATISDDALLRDAAIRAVVSEDGMTAAWNSGDKLVGVTQYPAYEEYWSERFSRLKDYTAAMDSRLATLRQSAALSVYQAAYPSAWAWPSNSSCRFVNYPFNFADECTGLGGIPATRQDGSCLVPACEINSSEGSACGRSAALDQGPVDQTRRAVVPVESRLPEGIRCAPKAHQKQGRGDCRCRNGGSWRYTRSKGDRRSCKAHQEQEPFDIVDCRGRTQEDR